MGRKAKCSTEEKVKAVEDYLKQLMSCYLHMLKIALFF